MAVFILTVYLLTFAAFNHFCFGVPFSLRRKSELINSLLATDVLTFAAGSWVWHTPYLAMPLKSQG
ncbi:hypothetical protein M5D96_003772 [Drosophila gunungcola]|uniref:Uncharacterized protein n=1 Tax=Drosophila gunungcola TaxID=103775 RepID=A0A9P9YSQ2_9MUSC|nr:hypothetical protein M5D96_003772 [Drosophila gunungcola]